MIPIPGAILPERIARRVLRAALAASVGVLPACDNLDPFQAPATPTPEAPISLVALPGGSTSIGLTWASAPGDTLATQYRLFRDGVATVTLQGTSHTDAGLTPSTTYTYWVYAMDADGHMSTGSMPATATTFSAGQSDTTAPTAPTSLVAVPASSSAISLNWNASDDGSGVLGYRVFRGGVEIAQAAGTTYSDGGLSPSTLYAYTVAAYDAAGNLSDPSNQASATTLAEGGSDTEAPSAPGSLSATATSSTSAALSWSAATDDVGVLGYRIFRNGSEVGTSSSTGFNDTGLSPSTVYSYSVIAFDAAGNNSSTSPSAIVTTPAGSQPDTQAPTAPGTLNAVATGSSSIDLSWSVATDNVGVTGYRIIRNGAQVGTATSTSYIDLGLTPSTTYTYTVIAYDAANNASAASAPASATTNAVGGGDTQSPGAPAGLSATATGTSTVDVAWSASTDNVGVTGYRIFRNGNQVGTTSSTSFTDSGLSAATVYTYSVVAFDAAGNTSAPSGSATATTQSPPDTQAPAAPTSLSATATSFSSIALNWSPSSDNVGVTGYIVYRGGVQVGTATGTSFTDTGLTPLTSYSYTVRARDAANNLSPHSASASATTLPLVP
jgi:chitodextrinase